MPDSNLIAAKDMRYGTRMLKAGEPLTLNGPNTRLYRALKAVRDPTDAEAKKFFGAAKQPAVAATPPVKAPPPAATSAPKPKRKAAPKKRAAAKKK